MEIFKGVNGLYYLLALLAGGAVLERLIPWRRSVEIDPIRWLRNASMAFYGAIILGLIPFIAGYGGAKAAEANGLGLLNQLSLPLWAELALSIVIIDALSYLQHRILHKWYFFWRAHRVHHSDKQIDVSTSLRFHPFETVFRATLEAGLIFVIGLPPEGILLSFGVLVFFNTITHANVVVASPVERALSTVFVTPDIHRLHHSTAPARQFTNFGTVFTVWDRLFGTYCAGHSLRKSEIFGIEGTEAIEHESFANLALDPFRTPVGGAIPRPVSDKTAAEKSQSMLIGQPKGKN